MRKYLNYFNIVALVAMIVFLLLPIVQVGESFLHVFSNDALVTWIVIIGVLLIISPIIMSFFPKLKLSAMYFIFEASAVALLFTLPEVVHNVEGVSRSNITLQGSAYGIITVAVAYAGYFFMRSNEENSLTVKDMVEIALFVSIALILDMPLLKIKVGQNGGSISLTMVPLVVLCVRKGFVKGFIGSGLIFAILNCVIDPYGLIYFPFDYFFAFGALAIVGLFSKYILNNKEKWLGLVVLIGTFTLAVAVRTMSHTISGLIWFQPITFVESLVYQLNYLVASWGGCLAILILLYPALLALQKRGK